MATEWKKGDFAVIHGDTLVRLRETPSPGLHVDFVAYYEHGCGLCCGGSRIGGKVDELQPVTSAEHILLSRAYAAMVARDEAKVQLAKQEATMKVQLAAFVAVKDAQRAALKATEG